jgi:hypothetical protein
MRLNEPDEVGKKPKRLHRYKPAQSFFVGHKLAGIHQEDYRHP